MAKPKLRQIRAFMAQGENGEPIMGLSDARQIADGAVFTSPAAQHLLPLMDGNKGLDEIVAAVGRGLNRAILEEFIAQLDGAGLLYGPTFDAIQARMRNDFDSSPVLPPASTAAFTDFLMMEAGPDGQPVPPATPPSSEATATRFREVLDQWIAEGLKDAQKPSVDALPKAIVAPHLDYPRGWLNYANAWGRLRVCERPARVVILGTNHFGESTGVCGCDKGYETVFGTCDVDKQLVDALRANLGPANAEKLFANRFDHEREHSIELQIPWLQHCIGKDDAGNYPKVFAALIHDPTVNNGESYDGNGLGLTEFLAAMKSALASLPGKTLVVSSADLSHMGQAFGDEQSPAAEGEEGDKFRQGIMQHDREMVGMIGDRKADELIAAMAWQQNPTRWCSIGNIVATLKLTEPQSVELFKYVAAVDQTGTAMVSSVSMMMN